jgi:hypothetical protein
MPDAAANPCPDLPALPPAADLEIRPVLKHCLAAHAALAELRLTAQQMSTPAIAAAMARFQAQDSVAIATSRAPPRQAPPYQQGRREDCPGSDAASSYHVVLLQAVHSLGAAPLSGRLAAAVTTRPSRRRGRAGLPCAGTATLALAAWQRSLKLPSDLDPLVRMAVQHHHLLALQPFDWASGPTGRIVNLLALLEDGLIDVPNLNLSRYLRRSPGAYDRLLAGVTTLGDWQPWLFLYMLRATELAAAWSSETIRAIRALLDATAAQVRARAPKHFSPQLMELIFLEPYCRIGDLVARGLGERHRASCVLKELVRLGILQEERCWRDKVFVNRRYLDLLASDEPAAGPDPRDLAQVASRPRAQAQAA